MDPELNENYDSSDDEDYVPPETAEDDDKDDIVYDDVEDDIINGHKSDKVEVKHNANQPKSEDEQKRIDQLWADFLDGDNMATTSAYSTTPTKNETGNEQSALSKNVESPSIPTERGDAKKTIVTDIFDFAGETVEVKRTVEINGDNRTNGKDHNPDKRRNVKRSGGLANAAALLSKKKKMTVLDKTSHDWNQFVEKEGIEEELKSHNRSRNSYLDKQEFLLKADYSQFEKEKALRQIERSKNK